MSSRAPVPEIQAGQHLTEEQLRAAVDQSCEATKENTAFIEEQARLMRTAIAQSEERRVMAEGATVATLRADNSAVNKQLRMANMSNDLVNKKHNELTLRHNDAVQRIEHLENSLHDATTTITQLSEEAVQAQAEEKAQADESERLRNDLAHVQEEALKERSQAKEDSEILQGQITSLQGSLAKSSLELQEQSHAAQLLRTELSSTQQALATATDVNVKRDDQLKEHLAGALAGAHAEVEELSLTKTSLMEQLDLAREDMDSQRLRLEEELREQSKEFEEVITHLQEKLRGTHSEIGRLEEVVQSARTQCTFQVESVEASRGAMSKELSDLKALCADLQGRNRGHEDTIREMQAQKPSLEHRPVQTTSRYVDVPGLHQTIEELRAELTEVKVKYQALLTDHSALEAKHEALSTEATDVRQQLTTTQQTLTKCNTRLTEVCEVADASKVNAAYLQEQLSKTETDLKMLRLEHQQVVESNDRKMESLDKDHASIIEALSGKASRAEENASTRQQRLEESENTMLDLQTAYETQSREREGLDEELRSVRDEAAKLEEQVQSLQLRTSGLEQRSTEQERELNQHRIDASEHGAAIQHGEAQLEAKEKELASLSKAHSKTSEECAELRAERSSVLQLLLPVSPPEVQQQFEILALGGNQGQLEEDGSAATKSSLLSVAYPLVEDLTRTQAVKDMYEQRFEECNARLQLLVSSLHASDSGEAAGPGLRDSISSFFNALKAATQDDPSVTATFPATGADEVEDHVLLAQLGWSMSRVHLVEDHHRAEAASLTLKVQGLDKQLFDTREELNHALAGRNKSAFIFTSRPHLLKALIDARLLIADLGDTFQQLDVAIEDQLKQQAPRDPSASGFIGQSLDLVAEGSIELENHLEGILKNYFTAMEVQDCYDRMPPEPATVSPRPTPRGH